MPFDCALVLLRLYHQPCVACAAAEGGGLGAVDGRAVVAKMERHLLTKFLALTMLCYLVGAHTQRVH